MVAPDSDPTPPATQLGRPDPWHENPDLAAAVAEIEEFVAGAGWSVAPALFALLPTADLVREHPALVGDLDAQPYTAIAQDPLPAGGLADALAGIGWPDQVAGAVLALPIVVPAADGQGSDRDARLVVGVLRGAAGGACLLRLRPDAEHPDPAPPLRGGALAPELLEALQQTFSD